MSAQNAGEYISKSIESILNQSYKNIELLIIDDGSLDNTYEVMKEFKRKEENVYIFKNTQNKGLTKSLNILLQNTQGKYIARQDADDTSHKERIAIQVKYLEQHNLDFCSTRAIIKQNDRVVPGISYYLPLKVHVKLKNPMIHGTLLIKKDIISEIGGYDESFLYAQDYKLLRDLLNNKYKYKIIKDPLYVLNMQDNISTKFKSEQKLLSDKIRKNKV
jgi:glycosyltransferase involved in cell wall biosynthesis